MGGVGKAGAVSDGDREEGGGPASDSGHRGQDRVKRLGVQQGADRVTRDCVGL